MRCMKAALRARPAPLAPSRRRAACSARCEALQPGLALPSQQRVALGWCTCSWRCDCNLQRCPHHMDMQACWPGSYSNAGAGACTACPAGSVSEVAGSPSCTYCIAGTFQPFSNKTACLDCGTGTYSSNGARACTACPKGSWNPDPRQASCRVSADARHGWLLAGRRCSLVY